MFETYLATEAGGPQNQDRAAVIERPNGLLLVVADGAGGFGGGAAAAELAIKVVQEEPVSDAQFLNPLKWSDILRQVDRRLSQHPTAGETTALLPHKMRRIGHVLGA